MKKVLSIIVLVILVIVFTPVLGNLYEAINGPVSSGFFGPENPQYIDGFLMSLMLFVSIWFGFTINKGYLIILGLVLLFDISLGVWDGFVINIVTGMIGIALGFLAKYVSIKIIPKKKLEGSQ